MKNRVLFFVFLMFCVLNIEIPAQIHYVPVDYSTIQAAINASSNGDTVLVDRGTYYENVNLRGKNITLASNFLLTNDPDDILNTIIDGGNPASPDTGCCIMLLSGEDSTTVVEGFTLTHGTGVSYAYIGSACNCIYSYTATWREGGAIALAKSSATIRNNLITDNTTYGGTSSPGGGAGIAAMYSNPKIINNVVVNNYAGYGCGITINISGGLVANNLIYHNYGGDHDNGGGILFWHAYPTIIENNTIVGNYTESNGGGIATKVSNEVTIRNNIVWGNRQAGNTQLIGTPVNCDIEEEFSGEGNIRSFPMFVSDTFTLAPGSLCIDAGIDSDDYNDPEDPSSPGNALYPSSGTLRNDMGAFGGPLAGILKSVHFEDIFVPDVDFGVSDLGTEKQVEVEILNRGTSYVTIDSMKFVNGNFDIIHNATPGGSDSIEIKVMDNDTITIEWTPFVAGNYTDTLLIYHSFENIDNPKKVVITGNALDVTVPTAIAGNDTITALALGTVRFDGSKSFDDNNLPLTYLWELVGKPAGSTAEILYVTSKRGTLQFDVIGEYYVTLTVNNGFFTSIPDTIKAEVVELSDINLNPSYNASLNLFPNPVTDRLYISIYSNESGTAKLTLTNIYGKTIAVTDLQLREGLNESEIDLKSINIPAGIYFINYSGTRESSARKFVYSSGESF